MKKLILTLVTAFGLAGGALAAGGGLVPLDKAPVDTTNQASLQNGAKLFVNYCLGCHSAAFMRFNRLKDIGLSEQEIKSNLLFTTDKVGDTMVAAIDPKQAANWFGANPPDLTVIARSRAGAGGSGADYLYTFLRTFYRDETKATGWNNLVFPSVGMPHVLWQLQGERRAILENVEVHGQNTQVFKGWETISQGTMSAQEYDQTVGDLVNFLQWMGEPAQNTRIRVGVGVLIFLGIFILIAWRLNAAFWKDVK
ncbi:MAG: cytochrome c1 [Comamonas sp.]|jgi:ubiquinol-cytochrome c reductase cytochrome c1 subunit|nr:cytochrome c1 [uncultured Comamonas sp.]MBP7646747.1 cytochrome c1 [Comamonas sp.]MBP8186611.1 cytochrome c1 [Comamonas sp.]MBP9940451.1 cytochrome c1 [Comamonas sp.]